jgi:hypothetical protein
MATTISRYNHTLKKLINKEVTYTTLKVMLLNDSATFDATDTTLTDVTNSGAYEVSGNGWTEGGETLASVAVTTVSTDGAMIDAADLEADASGGSIGPAYAAVIYDDTDSDDAPLWYVDFGEAKEADDGTPFKFTINASGLLRVTDAA